MKIWNLMAMALLAFGTAPLVFAHEGHHGPSAVEAPHGGSMRSLETVHLELVQDKDNFKIYLYTKDLKPKEVKDIPLTAAIKVPKGKPEPLQLKAAGTHWEGTYQGKDTHRFTLLVDIKQGGHQDKLEFTIERKK